MLCWWSFMKFLSPDISHVLSHFPCHPLHKYVTLYLLSAGQLTNVVVNSCAPRLGRRGEFGQKPKKSSNSCGKNLSGDSFFVSFAAPTVGVTQRLDPNGIGLRFPSSSGGRLEFLVGGKVKKGGKNQSSQTPLGWRPERISFCAFALHFHSNTAGVAVARYYMQ